MHSRNGLKKTLPGQKMSTSQVREGATEEIPSQWDNAAVKGDREQTVHTHIVLDGSGTASTRT